MDEELIKQQNTTPSALVVRDTYINAPNGMQIAHIDQLNLTMEQSIDALDALLQSIPEPITLAPPEGIVDEEKDYIEELYRAYGDAEGLPDFTEETLEQYEDYKDDLTTRRIDYFSAEAIRKSIDALQPEELKDQFSVLKTEIYNSVESTYRRRHPDGYECMLNVMDTAANSPVREYILERVPHWINNQIKKGVCHFLVIEGKLKWVKKRNG